MVNRLNKVPPSRSTKMDMDAKGGNAARAVTRVRRALGPKRAMKSLEIRKDNREIRQAPARGTYLRTLDEHPSMVTTESGAVKFRPMRPVPLRRGKL